MEFLTQLIFILFAAAFPLLIVSYLFFCFLIELFGPPFVPTSSRIIKKILDEANLEPGQFFIELGSGDGRVVREAVKNYGVRGLGVERHPFLVWFARVMARLERVEHIEYRRGNFFGVDLREADVIFMFLIPRVMKKLKGKLERECQKGTIIISHGFKIPGWDKKIYKTQPRFSFTTYFYKI